MAQKEPIRNFVLHDRHGHDIDFSSFSVVSDVSVTFHAGVGEPYCESRYQGGILYLDFYNIKGEGITNITYDASEEDGGTNYLHVTTDGENEYTFPVKNGSRGNGITSIDTEESQEDDGYNVVHIHCTDDESEDGTVLRVKNGSRGNGIASVTEELSGQDGGINTHTIHYTDPNVPDSVIHTRNGQTGRPGADRQPVESGDVIIAHGLGDDETKVMSQRAITTEIGYDEIALQLDTVGYIQNNGTFVNTGGYRRTTYIEVQQGQVIRYKGRIGVSALCVAGYDANEEFVSALLQGYDDGYSEYQVITIPEGIAYIAVASTDGYQTSVLMSGIGIKGRLKEVEGKAEEIGIIRDEIGEEFTNYPFVNQGYIDNIGVPNTTGGYRRTDLIAVVEGQRISYKGKIANRLFPCVATYNAEEEYQGALLYGTLDGYEEYQELTVPEGIAYIAAATTEGYTSGLVSIGKGIKQQIYDLEKEAEAFEEVKETIGREYEYAPFPSKGYIGVDGIPNTTDGYRRTDLIAVSEGDVFEYKGKIANNKFACVASYNEEQEYQGPLVTGRSLAYDEWQEITIPEGISYIMAASDEEHDYGLRKQGYGIVSRLANIEKEVGGHYLPNEYYGKKINWIGDSIVYGADFDELVCAYFGLVETDYGDNGSTIAVKESDITNRNPISIRYADMSDDADVIVVSAGTNDYQYDQTPFGQLGDTTYYTFYGALDVLCRGLIAKYPAKLIFFTTPIKRNQGETSSSRRELDTAQDVQNGLGKYLSDYAKAIKEVCAKYSIPVCDLYAESMLNPNMSAQASMFDNAGTHPTDEGRALMARRVRGFMKQLM